jgi:hypothetical protein
MASIINALSSGTGGIVTSGDASGILQLQTANTAAVTIDGSQNVGIGTSSPSEKLDVLSSGDLKARLYTTGTTVLTHSGLTLKTGSYEYLIQNLTTTAGSVGALRFYDITGGAERLRISSTGKVGIGNSSPDAQNLHVGSGAGGGSINGYTRLAIEASDYAVTTIKAPAANFSQIIFADPTSSNLGGINFFNSSYASGSNAMTFLTGGGTERMRISSGGIVTKPNNPAFVALGSGGSTSYGSGAEFILTNAVTNIGSHYNTSTGRFTAPVAGFYSFTYAIYSYAGSTLQIAFKKNGSDYAPGTDTEGLNTVVANYISGTSFMIYLAANDTASFGWRNGNSANIYHGHSWFSGHLVG